jgi:hypothetical protein
VKVVNCHGRRDQVASRRCLRSGIEWLVFDAIGKLITSASHSYSTGVVKGKPLSTETIYVQGKTYMIVKGGKWRLSPVTE